MKFEAIPDKTRFDFYYADDIADALNAAVVAVTDESLSLAGVLAWLAQRFRLEVSDGGE